MKIADEQPEPSNFGTLIYPWHEWADGQTRLAKQGEDFGSTATAFAQGCRAWAARNGYFAEVTQRDTRVWFSFTPNPAGQMSPREIMDKFIDQELIPEKGAWISQGDVLAGYAEWHRTHPKEPKASRRQILAGVRAVYPLRRKDGVVGYEGTR